MRRGRRGPRPIAVIDCETDPFEFGSVPLPFLWVIFDGQRYYEFEHTSDAIHFLESKEWVVYAHNGGKFDYHQPGFLESLPPFERVTIINGRLAKFKIGLCEFRDSFNILPVPLASYNKTKIDYDKFKKKNRHRHMEEIKAYCRDDCKYLYELVTAFRAEYGNNLTLAGAAMKTWQDRFNNEAPCSDERFFNGMAKYYFGGRVECFRTGMINEPFRMLDINSAYPYAMMHKHPISTAICGDDGDGDIEPQSFYIVECVSRGALPYKEHGKGELLFPHDDVVRQYRCSGWELLAAVETGTVEKLKIKRRVYFEEHTDFVRYIDYFYEMKKSSKKESKEYIFAKLFMNSLYGKFGANPQNYENCEIMPVKHKEAAEVDGYQFGGMLGPWAVMKSPLDPGQERYYNAATAASITGFVRAYLWRHICAVRRAGGSPIYCDTDSLAFAGDVPADFRLDKELGGWSVEGEFVRGGVAGKKLYAFDRGEGKGEKRWKYGCKGVRISPEEVLKVCQGEKVEYRRDAPSYSVRYGARFVTRIVTMTG